MVNKIFFGTPRLQKRSLTKIWGKKNCYNFCKILRVNKSYLIFNSYFLNIQKNPLVVLLRFSLKTLKKSKFCENYARCYAKPRDIMRWCEMMRALAKLLTFIILRQYVTCCNFWEKYVLPIFVAAHRRPFASTQSPWQCVRRQLIAGTTDWSGFLEYIACARKIHFLVPEKKRQIKPTTQEKFEIKKQPVLRNDIILIDGDGVQSHKLRPTLPPNTNCGRPVSLGDWLPRSTASLPSPLAVSSPWSPSVGGFSRKNGSRNLVVAMRWGTWVRDVRRSTTEDRRGGGFPLPRDGPHHVLGLRH